MAGNQNSGRRRGQGKPTALKILAGTARASRIDPNEPQPNIKLAAPPKHLSDEAKKEWRRIGKKLLRLGIVSEIDYAALGLYCENWSRWIEAELAMQKYGLMLVKDKFPTVSPYLKIANDAMAGMLRVLVEFGMTPSARTRVSARRVQANADPFQEFEGQRGNN